MSGCCYSANTAIFFVSQISLLNEGLGLSPLPWNEIALPLGISFFTFQKLSYIIDIFRRSVGPARSFVDYALYIALFPQLIAGPIVRYHDLAEQLRCRNPTPERFFDGIWRFAIGLAKKVLVANVVGQLADLAFASNAAGRIPLSCAWIGMLAYTFQIYFDFSGYSDMAIGLAKMMGFEFLENFNRPYISKSFTEFWRRWHISLTNWMRDYLYIPLGGNRKSRKRTYINLWIVFLISGFWHGASWSFILWGAYHGFFITLERWARENQLTFRLPVAVLQGVTFLLVAFGWVLFRSDTLEQAAMYFKSLFGIAPTSTSFSLIEWYYVFDYRSMAVLVLAALLSWLPWQSATVAVYKKAVAGKQTIDLALRFSISFLLILLCSMSLVTMKFNPFIYFRF